MSALVLHGLAPRHRPWQRTVVTVGVFDGVHIAHQRLISATCQFARRKHATSIVVTFDPDPQHVLHPSQAQPVLMPLQARLRAMAALGVDVIWVIPFTKSFAQLSAQAFVERILLGRLHATAVVLGEGFVFGKNQQGTMDTLRALATRRQVEVIAIPHVRRARAIISSSRIRTLITKGDLSRARTLLGRSPELYGKVVKGRGRGQRLGFPTANLRFTSQVLPPQGVYAVMVEQWPAHRRWKGVMNLGVRPTFGPGPCVGEVHLLRFHGQLLHQLLSVSLITRLRPERCFPSIDALRQQIRHDITRATSTLRHVSAL